MLCTYLSALGIDTTEGNFLKLIKHNTAMSNVHATASENQKYLCADKFFISIA